MLRLVRDVFTTRAGWALIVVGVLIVVMPVLGHAVWHLCRQGGIALIGACVHAALERS